MEEAARVATIDEKIGEMAKLMVETEETAQAAWQETDKMEGMARPGR